MAKNLVEVHEKAKTYDWAFTVGDQRPKWPTRYLIPPKGKDPFRMLIRDYVKMEAEKDDRTHGFLDGALRMGMAEEIQPRFMECLKLTLPDLTNAEFQAVSATGGIIASVQNQELRQGYQAQMLDEIRHTQLEMALRNYYVKHWRDPAGWDLAQKALYQHPGGIVSIGLFQNFNTGDPIDCIVNLNIVVRPGSPTSCSSPSPRSPWPTAITPSRRRSSRSSPMRHGTWPTATGRSWPSSRTRTMCRR